MRRTIKVVLGVVAFILMAMAALFYCHGERADGIPDAADEWSGQVDYAAIDAQLSAMMARPDVAGLAVAIVEGGEPRFVKGYGQADRSTGAKVTSQTVFRWASVSKTVTGALAASLAGGGKLDLDRPVARWNVSLRLPGNAQERLTFAQLLSHQTGLTKNAFDGKLEGGDNPQSLRAQLNGAPLQCHPGACHTYQNIAFDAASEILAQAANRPFEAAVQQRLFGPLGMTSARYGMAGLTQAAEWARPHKRAEVRDLKEAYWRVPAAAGVSSNILDFARWMQAMMGQRPKVIAPTALALQRAPRIATSELYSGDLAKALADPAYGLGIRSFDYGGRRLYGHSGAVDGYRATMIFDPELRLGVVAMWNSNWGIPFRIPFAVFDSYHRRHDNGWLNPANIPPPEIEVEPPSTG